jgi:hypothetical protein
MVGKSPYPRPRHLTLDEQIFHMSSQRLCFRLVKRRRQVEAVWRGSIQPTPLSEMYIVLLRFRPGWCPEVRVLSPELKPREGVDRLPHIFFDGSLCLHQAGEWQPGMLVASVIPWASAWLYFYEIWHATGLWLGGGTHPDRLEHRSE